MRFRTVTLLAVFAALLLSGCVGAVAQKVETFGSLSSGSRVLLMTPFVELAEVTAGGGLNPRADWTENAKVHVVAALTDELRAKKATLISYEEPKTDDKQRAQLQLIKVHALVGRAILTHYYNSQLQLPNKKGKFDWTLGQGVSALKEDYANADYALFTEFRDAYSTAGRVALNVAAVLFGGMIRYGRQVTLASVVDLRTGNIVWFNFVIDPAGDLRTQEAAQTAVQRLLANLLL